MQLGRNIACKNGSGKLLRRSINVTVKKQYKNTIICSKDPPFIVYNYDNCNFANFYVDYWMTKILIFLFSSIARFARLLSFIPNKSSFIFLSYFVKEVYTIHYYRYNPLPVEEEENPRLRINKQFLLFFTKNYIIMFHKKTSHTHTHRILSLTVYQKLYTYFKHYDCFSTH